MVSGERSSSSPPSETREDRIRAWLVAEGHLEPAPGGEYTLTESGRDFMLWALWQQAGSPGLPAPIYDGRRAT